MILNFQKRLIISNLQSAISSVVTILAAKYFPRWRSNNIRCHCIHRRCWYTVHTPSHRPFVHHSAKNIQALDREDGNSHINDLAAHQEILSRFRIHTRQGWCQMHYLKGCHFLLEQDKRFWTGLIAASCKAWIHPAASSELVAPSYKIPTSCYPYSSS